MVINYLLTGMILQVHTLYLHFDPFKDHWTLKTGNFTITMVINYSRVLG